MYISKVYLNFGVFTLLVQFVWPSETITFESEQLQITEITGKVSCEKNVAWFMRSDGINTGQKFSQFL